MSRAVPVLVLLASAALASCNTYRVEGAVTFGRVREVSEADIHAAIVAFHRQYADITPAQIEIVSHDEIQIYWHSAASGRSSIVKRVGGRWRWITDEWRGETIG